MHKIFNFHLSAFAVTQNEIARTDFVAKSFTLLSDTKRQVRVNGIDDVFVISKDALGSFGAKVSDGAIVIYGTNVSFKHHIKFANWSPIFFTTDWTLGVSSQKLLCSN